MAENKEKTKIKLSVDFFIRLLYNYGKPKGVKHIQRRNFKMAKLKDIDNKAAEKGSLLTTIWQFVKFIVVSLLAMLVLLVESLQRLAKQVL